MLLVCWPVAAAGQTAPWQPNPIVRYWDLHINPLEFRTPIRLVPLAVKGGLAFYGGPGMFDSLPLSLFQSDHTVVLLDSTESELAPLGSVFRRMSLVYDLDLLQVNLRHRFWPVSLVDVMVGVGLRTNQIPFSPSLPDNWKPENDVYKFAPVFHHGLATLTINYQRWERWYVYLQMTRGVTVGSVYRADVLSRYLKGTGTSGDLAIGLQRFAKGGGNPRYAVGAELRYQRLDVSDLNDPDGITPIEGLQLRSLGLFFTISLVFGGQSTTADRAKRDLYSGDYMAAVDNLRTFLNRYPRHTRAKRARRLLAVAKKMVPYQQLELARAFQDSGAFEQALTWYDRAEAEGDTALTVAITTGRAEIGYRYLQQADSLLQQGDLERASRLLRTTQQLLPADEALVERYTAEVLIRQGHGLRAQGGLDAALRRYDRAIGADPSREVEIEGYKVRIAEDLLKEASVAADRSALALALQSLKQSQALDPRRKAQIDTMVVRLESRLNRLAQGEIRRSMEAQMQEARELRGKVAPTRPRIGLLVSSIEDILGRPDHVTQDNDRFGVNHQLWEYGGGEHPGLYYFEDYVLMRVEPLP
ncbi:MAG: hypothetical protein IIB42_03030 [Candidatus Marinimicrobia bacterium]|nr:hypothetical protein [Candidatus Neomarinimicrobiota bacterium]